jgi:hypothetical protein
MQFAKLLHPLFAAAGTRVEVAIGGAALRGRMALLAIGLDVTAFSEHHHFGQSRHTQWFARDGPGNVVKPFMLRLNSSRTWGYGTSFAAAQAILKGLRHRRPKFVILLRMNAYF